jgi:hypothetical protein
VLCRIYGVNGYYVILRMSHGSRVDVSGKQTELKWLGVMAAGNVVAAKLRVGGKPRNASCRLSHSALVVPEALLELPHLLLA